MICFSIFRVVAETRRHRLRFESHLEVLSKFLIVLALALRIFLFGAKLALAWKRLHRLSTSSDEGVLGVIVPWMTNSFGA
mmetsp:Transcript_31690/g.60523  ORF Transcript_31690/g.60523 Transcript_31690/m.60523 type:complete len:80 (+) Transcript_31690:220-459(+)